MSRFAIGKIETALGADDETSVGRALGERRERATDEELEGLIRSGESFHGPMTQLTARAINRGEPARAAIRRLQTLMLDSEGRDDPKRRDSWQQTFDDIPRMVHSATQKYPQGVVRSRLRKREGKVIPDEENVRLILENDPALEGLVRYDELSMRRVLTRPVPGDPAVVVEDGHPRPWRDEDSVAIQQYVQRGFIPGIGREKVDGALGGGPARSGGSTRSASTSTLCGGTASPGSTTGSKPTWA